MKITYLGTNTLLFNEDQTSLLIDPHFTRPRKLNLLSKIRPEPEIIAENLARFEIRKLEGVLLTHTHYDHALDAVEVIRQAGGVLYGSASAVHLARGAGWMNSLCAGRSRAGLYHRWNSRCTFTRPGMSHFLSQ
jgi:L-ascorbate metabolism protein UlaG (beta-lactamase superfamily)